MLNRRLTMTGAAAATATLAMPSILRSQPTSLVTTFTGGKLLEVYRQTVVTPFEAKFGVTVNIKSGTPNEWLTNTIVNRTRPEIDLLWLVDARQVRIPEIGGRKPGQRCARANPVSVVGGRHRRVIRERIALRGRGHHDEAFDAGETEGP